MAQYSFYLDKCLLPIAPSQLTITINNNNKTYILIDEGEINVLKKAKLTAIEFECIIPQIQYPFAVYTGGFQKAQYFMDYFEQLKTKLEPFQFIVSRTLPNGTVLFSTNMKVSMEDYKITESQKSGFDLTVKIKLKQYREYATKTCTVTVKQETSAATAVIQTARPPSTVNNAPDSGLPTTYTVKKGDCLWNIAKKYYGNGSKYTLISGANDIKNANLIYPGQVLTIPAA